MSHGEASVKRGRTTEYVAWRNMIDRCENSARPDWARYGGRGISVCAKWRASFRAFLADMGRKPSATHSIDRVDNSRGYEPANCRWATPAEQARNTRSIRLVADGLCLAEAARAAGITREMLAYRLNKGEGLPMALRPARVAKRYAHNGQHLTLEELSLAIGIPVASLHRRLKQFGSVADAASAWRKNNRGKRNLSEQT